MYIETWLKIACPSCEKVNWVNQGDVTDMTVADDEGFQCWYCSCNYPFDEEVELDKDDVFPMANWSPTGKRKPRKN